MVLVGVLAGGCLGAGGTLCDNGRTCPDNLACDETHDACVEPSQLTSCEGLGSGEDCGIHGTDDGLCDQGICIVKRCGDGYRRGNEACDGDDVPMEASCKDLGFYDSGAPKCNDACSFDVNPETTVCTGYCGDGMLTPGIEVCEADVPLTSTCLDFGFGTGGLECADCRPDQRDCVPFGWQLTNLGASVIAVHASAADDVWALLVDTFTYENSIAHYDGTTWSLVDLSACALDPMTEYLFDIWSPAKGVLFAEGGEAVIRVTPTTCEKPAKPPGLEGNYFTMWSPGATEVWAATVSNPTSQVWQYDGANWNLKLSVPIANGTPWKIWGSGPTDVWVLLNSPDSLAHYNGSNWQMAIDPGLSDPRSIWGSAANDVYVGDGQSTDIAHYDGLTWSAFPSPPATLAAILNGATASDGKVYVVGYGSHVVVYDGVSWTDIGAPSSGPLWAGPGGDIWQATGEAGSVAHFAGSGRVAASSNTARQALAMRTTTDAYSFTYVPGPSGDLQLEHWDGASWTIDPAVPAPGDVEFSPTGKVMAVAWHNLDDADDGLYIRATNGAWSHPANVGEALEVSVVADDNVWLLGFGDIDNSANVFHWTSASSITRFEIAKPVGSPTPSFADIWAFSNTNIYVVGYSQDSSVFPAVNTPVILHSNGDPAATWTSETLPAINDSLDRIRPHSPTDLYVITHRGKLLHSTGDGTWVVMDTPPSLKVRDVSGPPDDLFIATDNQLWRSDGVRWEPVSLGAPVAASQVMLVGSVIVALEGGTLHRIVRLTPW